METKRLLKIYPCRRRVMQALVVTVLFACAFSLTFRPSYAQAVESTPMIPASFSKLAEKVSPAVVNISTVRVVKDSGGFFAYQTPPHPRGPEEFQDPFEFFKRFFGPQFPPRERKERSLGSGFIIDPGGFILTNNHVVENAQKIVVLLSSGEKYKGKVIGRDPKTDIALVKIDAGKALPFVKLGDSDKLKVGDWVVAIGNPFGLDHTVTAGIISAKGRVIGAGPYDNFLQTDASINPGNSGGPLINLNAEVIGINTAITATGQGIGFAIPSNLAKEIVGQLRKTGRVIRGWLGVVIQPITPELAKSFKLKEQTGALVADVDPHGPAKKAGIKRGDIIVAFNGKKIKKWSDLPPLVAASPVGSQAVVEFIRNGKIKTVWVKLAELKEEKIAGRAPVRKEFLGLVVQELTPELARQFGADQEHGVIITGIDQNSVAADAGLRPGDIILEINRQPITSMDSYNRAIRKINKGDIVLFLVKRGQTTLFYTMQVE